MVGVQGVGLGDHPIQDAFNDLNSLARRKAGAVGNAENMGINGIGVVTEGHVHHHIGRLATNTWQGDQIVAILRHITGWQIRVVIKQALRQRHDILGLALVKADGLDVLAHGIFTQSQHFCRCIGNGKQAFGGFVDAGIGCLRGQNHSDQQRVGVDMLQLSLGFRLDGMKGGKQRFDLVALEPGARWPRSGRGLGGFFGHERPQNGAGFGKRLVIVETTTCAILRLMTSNNPISEQPPDTNASARPVFSARLTPHRSLPLNGFVALMALIGVLSLSTALMFLAVGAWPIVAFLALDVVIIFLAFQLNYTAARAYEDVIVTRSELIVRRVNAWGRVTVETLHPFWTRLKTAYDEDAEQVLAIKLESKGQQVPVGAFLNPDDKESFANALGDALATVKRGAPV